MDPDSRKEDSVLSVSDAVPLAKNEVASMPSTRRWLERSGFRGLGFVWALL